MALNYAQLAVAIEETTENSEDTFRLNLGNFVRQAEQRIYVDAQIPPTRRMSVGACSPGSPYAVLPSGFLTPLSLAVVQAGVHTPLLNKEVGFIREAYPDVNATDVPKYYALFNEQQFILGPTPASNYALEVQYMGFPASIVDTGTSWLGNNFETVLLYGSLLNAYVFMKGEPDVLKMYEAMYTSALESMKKVAKLTHGDEFRNGARA